MKKFGAAYRALYSAEGLFSRAGCPPIDSIYIWTDLDQRTKATGTALLEGLAPGCGLKPRDAEATIDPLFHALPSLGKADSAQAERIARRINRRRAAGDRPGVCSRIQAPRSDPCL